MNDVGSHHNLNLEAILSYDHECSIMNFKLHQLKFRRIGEVLIYSIFFSFALYTAHSTGNLGTC